MSNIIMGNDDFILYIRKKQKREADKVYKSIENYYINNKRNNVLGKEIWGFIETEKLGVKCGETNTPCVWNPEDCNDDGYFLPKTAAQFEIECDALPKIFKKLDELIDQMK